MKNTLRSLVLVPVLASVPMAALATSAELTITGTITPAVCTPSFSGGGTINHGPIAPADLSATQFTLLNAETVQLTITCDAPGAFAVSIRDERPDAIPAGIETFLNAPAGAVLGLGGSTDKPTGAYTVSFAEGGQQGDSGAITPISRATSSGAWTALSGNQIIVNQASDMQYSWASTGTTPGAYNRVDATLNIATALNRTGDLPSLSSELELQGRATLTLFHL